MKLYVADTNIFLRLFLNDNKKLFRKAESLLQSARNGKITIIIVPQIIFEIEYVLRKVYKLQKEEIVKYLSSILQTDFFKIDTHDLLLQAVEDYERVNVDLVDVYLFAYACWKKAEVLTFDKDLSKLKK